VEISLSMALTDRLKNRLPLLLWCLVALPLQAAQPAGNLTSSFTDASACGDPARTVVLRQRILGTIRAEVLRRTSPEPVTVEESDLQIQACPPQKVYDSEFVIKRAEYDAVRDVTVFWLASSQASNIPPLIVTVHKQRSMRVLVAKRDLRNGQPVSIDDLVEVTQSSGNVLSPAAGLAGTGPSQFRTEARRTAVKNQGGSVLLVKVGMPSELVISGKNFRGTMTVIPLESGGRGQELRVREPGTQRVLRARVTDANQLEQIF